MWKKCVNWVTFNITLHLLFFCSVLFFQVLQKLSSEKLMLAHEIRELVREELGDNGRKLEATIRFLQSKVGVNLHLGSYHDCSKYFGRSSGTFLCILVYA